MRSIFLLVLALLVLKAFFPTVGNQLEAALLALLNLAIQVFTSASAAVVAA